MALTLHTADVVLPVGAPPMRDGAVLVDGERIAAVGSSEQCLSGRDRAAVRVRSWPGILMPGLVNAHAHLQYGPAFADLADGTRPFASWIGELTSRRRAMAAGGWREQVSSSWQQALSTGTTSVADVVSNVEALGVTVEGVRYIESVGLPSRLWSPERARLVRLLAAGCRAFTRPVAAHALHAGDRRGAGGHRAGPGARPPAASAPGRDLRRGRVRAGGHGEVRRSGRALRLRLRAGGERWIGPVTRCSSRGTRRPRSRRPRRSRHPSRHS